MSLRFAGGASPSPTTKPFIFLLKYSHLFLQNLGSVEQSNFHRITSVRKPFWSVCYRVSFRGEKVPCLLLGRTAKERIARHRKTPRVLCGGRYDRLRWWEAFAPLKAQKPHPRGCPRGRNPLGLFLSQAFFTEVKKA